MLRAALVLVSLLALGYVATLGFGTVRFQRTRRFALAPERCHLAEQDDYTGRPSEHRRSRWHTNPARDEPAIVLLRSPIYFVVETFLSAESESSSPQSSSAFIASTVAM